MVGRTGTGRSTAGSTLGPVASPWVLSGRRIGSERVSRKPATDAGGRGEGTAFVRAMVALVGVLATGIAAELVREGVISTNGPVAALVVTLGTGVVAATVTLLGLRPRTRPESQPAGMAGDDADELSDSSEGAPRQAPAYDALVRLSSRLNEAKGLDAVLSAVTEEAATAMRTPVAIFLPERSRERLFLAAAHALPDAVRRVWPAVSRDALERVFGDEPFFIASEVATSELPDREIHAAVGIRSAAMARMGHRDELVGVIASLSLDTPHAFTDDDLAVLRGITHQAAQAIANAWLLARVERRLGLTQALRNIDIAIAGSMDLGVTLNVILEEVARQLHADASSVLLLDARDSVLRYAASRGFRTSAVTRSELRLGEDRAGTAALERRVVSIADLRKSTTDTARRWLYDAEEAITYHALPLLAKGTVKGVLEIFHRSPFEPDAEWREFAEAIAGQAAIAIDSATLFADLQRANEGLLLAYDNTLEGWSRALDLRDRETEGHTQRVTELTLRLAGTMGLVTDDLVHVRRGAILHDIGKMGIPDAILLKPGPLTDDEWLVMRRHPMLAFELLSPIPYLKPALDIPFCHHEKWDGTGYPRGLSGEQIPVAARIFAIADVWDALRSDRPYRPAWPTTDVRDYIHSLAGTHFDPRVVDLFERVHVA
jgi:HD-GYP domain-containing protein (c-di-GMP phosphodiesterase class II)